MHFHILSPTESPRLKLDLRLGAGKFARDSRTGAFHRGKAFTISELKRASLLKVAAISFTSKSESAPRNGSATPPVLTGIDSRVSQKGPYLVLAFRERPLDRSTPTPL